MKTTLLSIFLFVTSICYSQSSDIIYLPQEKSVVASYNFNYNRFGLYLGGVIASTFPSPYIYTTPTPRINRVGLSLGNGKINIMGGGYIENYSVDSIKLQPDIWIKVYPLRILTKTNQGFDFIFAMNYMKTVRYGFGISIPFGGIYLR